jgi:hypothetical protein
MNYQHHMLFGAIQWELEEKIFRQLEGELYSTRIPVRCLLENLGQKK